MSVNDLCRIPSPQGESFGPLTLSHARFKDERMARDTDAPRAYSLLRR